MLKKAKFIKLGWAGAWSNTCFKDGTLRLAYYEVPHDAGLRGNKDAISKVYQDKGMNAGTVTSHTRQVLDFYNSGPENLWITFYDGCLYWCIAEKPVEFLGHDKEKFPDGSRLKRTKSGWRNTSLGGKILKMSELSGRLTRTAAYRATICDINPTVFEYLIRKISDEDLPETIAVKNAQATLLEKIKPLIRNLTPQDFEIFVDIIFSQSGWKRISAAGKAQVTLDLELILPTTDERAVVQVKSSTNQAQLNEYIERFSGIDADKYFYVYHTAKGVIDASNSEITVIDIDRLAELALNSGLVSWLIEKSE